MRKVNQFNQKRFWVILGILGLGSFWGCTSTKRGELIDLKTKYPVVIYRGPKEPFDVKIQRDRPSTWVSLENIPKVAVMAVVVSEDWAFYSHKGIDPKQIKEAIEDDLTKGKGLRGASTITQQVVKNVFLSNERSFVRKIREAWLATQLERVVSKKRILETYLNIAEFGEGVFGIGPAAQFYFSKSASQLNAKEGAFLAMLLPSPKKYAVSFRKKELTPFARKIVKSILEKLVRANVLSSDEKSFEWARPLVFERKTEEGDPKLSAPSGLSEESLEGPLEEETVE